MKYTMSNIGVDYFGIKLDLESNQWQISPMSKKEFKETKTQIYDFSITDIF